jgi:hypothetical protein
MDSHSRSSPALAGPRRRQPRGLYISKRPPTAAASPRIAFFIMFMSNNCLHIHTCVTTPSSTLPPSPRRARVRLISACTATPLPRPPSHPAPPTRASRPAPARGWMHAYIHTRMVDAHALGTTYTCSPRFRRRRPTPIQHRSRQPACAATPTAPRCALAAPRDGHALRVGALEGPPLRLLAATGLFQPASSLSVTVRRRCAALAPSSNPSGTRLPPARRASLVLLCARVG